MTESEQHTEDPHMSMAASSYCAGALESHIGNLPLDLIDENVLPRLDGRALARLICAHPSYAKMIRDDHQVRMRVLIVVKAMHHLENMQVYYNSLELNQSHANLAYRVKKQKPNDRCNSQEIGYEKRPMPLWQHWTHEAYPHSYLCFRTNKIECNNAFVNT